MIASAQDSCSALLLLALASVPFVAMATDEACAGVTQKCTKDTTYDKTIGGSIYTVAMTAGKPCARTGETAAFPGPPPRPSAPRRPPRSGQYPSTTSPGAAIRWRPSPWRPDGPAGTWIHVRRSSTKPTHCFRSACTQAMRSNASANGARIGRRHPAIIASSRFGTTASSRSSMEPATRIRPRHCRRHRTWRSGMPPPPR